MSIKVLLSCLFFWTVSPLLIAEELNYNLYQLHASANEDIANDLMVVTLKSLHQADSAQQASEQVNKDMQWALSELSKDARVSAKTEGYRTYPQYRNEKIRAWTVAQNLRLESDDFEWLTDKIAKLQERLNVQSMSFGVKPETRTILENKLMTEVLAAYRQRADIVVNAMQAKGYKIVNTSINTQGSYSPQFAQRSQGKSLQISALSESHTQPAVESGETKITVNVNGQVQLEF